MAMMHRTAPAEAYRSVEFDARIDGADRRELVSICFEQLVGALGTAIHADAIRDPALRSSSLSRAVSSILALEMGLIGDDPVVTAMRDLYARARSAILDSAARFEADKLARIRADFQEIGAAMRAG